MDCSGQCAWAAALLSAAGTSGGLDSCLPTAVHHDDQVASSDPDLCKRITIDHLTTDTQTPVSISGKLPGLMEEFTLNIKYSRNPSFQIGSGQ